MANDINVTFIDETIKVVFQETPDIVVRYTAEQGVTGPPGPAIWENIDW